MRAWFIALILLGLFGCLLYGALADRYCPVEEGKKAPITVNDINVYQGVEGGYQNADNHYRYSDENVAAALFLLANTKENEGNYKANPAEEHPRKWVSIVCEVKAADIALVFFTYCLVLVTWWLVKVTSILAEHTPKVERAYISGGGVRTAGYGGMMSDGFPRLVAAEGNEFQFRINNYGKTPGNLLRVGWNFCDETAIPPEPEYIFEEWPIPIDPGRHGEPIFERPIPQTLKSPVVYGRFFYKTIFKTRHSSGFIYRIARGQPSAPIRPPSVKYTEDRDGDA